MERIKIIDAHWEEGDLYEVPGECGLMTLPYLHIAATDEAGNCWFHRNYMQTHATGSDPEEQHIYSNYHGATLIAEARVAAVRAAGSIDPEHWAIYNRPSYSRGEVSEYDLMDDEERARYGYR